MRTHATDGGDGREPLLPRRAPRKWRAPAPPRSPAGEG